jgi:hypothetical protein
MTFAEGMKAIWGGVISTFAKFVADWIAKRIMLAVVDAAATRTEAASNAEATAGNATEASSNLYKTWSNVPYGVGLAAAGVQTAAMLLSLAATYASAYAIGGGTKVPAAAEGAWFGRPTLTMIGEGSRPELVIPDTSFETYSKNLAAGILAQNAGKRDTGGSGSVNVHLHNATILDTSNRGMEKLGNMVLSGIQVAGRRRGQVIKPGFVFGGI